MSAGTSGLVPGSRDVASAAIRIALTTDRAQEHALRAEFLQSGIKACAADFGGDFIASTGKIIERAIVAAKREGLIGDSHAEEGSVAGATHEALAQIMTKAIGLNIGGKIGVARYGDHVSVALFFGIGLLHLNDVGIGLGHRVI